MENLVTFRRWDGVKDEKFEYYGGSLKNPIFRGGGLMKNQYIYIYTKLFSRGSKKDTQNC